MQKIEFGNTMLNWKNAQVCVCFRYDDDSRHQQLFLEIEELSFEEAIFKNRLFHFTLLQSP
jgi:hypothetical protein